MTDKLRHELKHENWFLKLFFKDTLLKYYNLGFNDNAIKPKFQGNLYNSIMRIFEYLGLEIGFKDTPILGVIFDSVHIKRVKDFISYYDKNMD